MKNRIPVLPLVALITGSLLADSATIVGGGYNSVVPIAVAPGQVVTVFVIGLLVPTEPISATTIPLPYKLAGISATLLSGPAAVPVPILAISSLNTCALNVPVQGLSCGNIAAVTLQIPFELVVDTGSLSPPTLSYLTVSDNAGHSSSVRLFAEPDQIRIVGSGNSLLGGGTVTHADGSIVDDAHPAKPGEEVVMYALGLGKTTPAVATGTASPSPAASTQGFHLNFDYRPNATPSPGPSLILPSSSATPLFAGLTPGFVGLYQINFRIPTPPGPLSACGGSVGYGANPFASVLSNLTVTVVGAASFGGAGVCVAPAS